MAAPNTSPLAHKTRTELSNCGARWPEGMGMGVEIRGFGAETVLGLCADVTKLPTVSS